MLTQDRNAYWTFIMIVRISFLVLLAMSSTVCAQEESTPSSLLDQQISIVEAFYQLRFDQLEGIDAAIADPEFPLERKSAILEMRIRNAVPQVLLSLVGEDRRNPPLQLAAKWEIVRRATDSELVRLGRSSVQVTDKQVEPYILFAEKLTGTQIPPFWQEVLRNAKYQSNGEFDVFGAWEVYATDSRDLGYEKSQLVGHRLLVENGTEQVSVEVGELAPNVKNVNLVEIDERQFVVFVDYIDRSIHVVDAKGSEENRVLILNIATNWTFLKSPQFEAFPIATSDHKNIIVYYANPACVGIASVSLESWTVVWNGACIF